MAAVPTIRELLARKEVLLGAGHYLPHYDYTGVIAAAGFDFIFIDAEHGNRSIESLQHCVTTANRYGVPAIVRAKDKTQGDIEQALDIGAQGVMMPTLETVEDAELLVHSARFGPVGDRGWNPFGPWTGYSQDQNSFKNHHSEVFVVGLIETPLGHENLDEILKVPGIDALMPGPGDLAVKMGAEMGAPEVWDLVSTATRKIVDAGRIAWSGGYGGATYDADAVAAGTRMVNAASDSGLLGYLRGKREALQAELDKRGLGQAKNT
ncbi:HpcH/HpaI aldolase family protein [Streptomyces sp. JW3]|uniref:HpcH/HpaI aldolase family protein n=1 Tax=Streptomyces sp. JW3 TaxID=3456955 RepID=UPI003FA45F1E